MPEDFDAYHQWFGIPPEQQPPDCYQLLGIRRFEPNPTVISHAAERQLLMLKSQERGAHADLALQLRKQVAEARVQLLDAAKRAQYDQHLREHLKQRTTPPPVPAAAIGSEDGAPGALLADPELVGLSRLPEESAPPTGAPAAAKAAGKWGIWMAITAVAVTLLTAAATLFALRMWFPPAAEREVSDSSRPIQSRGERGPSRAPDRVTPQVVEVPQTADVPSAVPPLPDVVDRLPVAGAVTAEGLPGTMAADADAEVAPALDVPEQLNVAAAVQATGAGYVYIGHLGPGAGPEWAVTLEDYVQPAGAARFRLSERSSGEEGLQWPIFWQATAGSAGQYAGRVELKSGSLALHLLDPQNGPLLVDLGQCALVVTSGAARHHVQLSMAETLEPVVLDFESSKQTISLGHVPLLSRIPADRLELEVLRVSASSRQWLPSSGTRAACGEGLSLVLDESLQCSLELCLVKTAEDSELVLTPRYQRRSLQLPMAPSKLERELARMRAQLVRNQRDLSEAQLALQQLPPRIAQLNATAARTSPEIAYKKSQLAQMNSRLNAAQTRVRRLVELMPEMAQDVERMERTLEYARGLAGQLEVRFRVLARGQQGSFVILVTKA